MLKGMATVAKHLFRPGFTTDFPEETHDLPEVERGRLLFLEERCIKCKQCERICPNGTISMEVSRDVKGESEEKLILDGYNIHHGSCLICDLCVEVCPTDTLAWADVWETPTYERDALFFDRERLEEEVKRVPLDRVSDSSNYDLESYLEDLEKKKKEGEL